MFSAMSEMLVAPRGRRSRGSGQVLASQLVKPSLLDDAVPVGVGALGFEQSVLSSTWGYRATTVVAPSTALGCAVQLAERVTLG
jgi:hypothetical protein